MTATGLKGNWELKIETLLHYNNPLPGMFEKALFPGHLFKGIAIKDFKGVTIHSVFKP